MAMGQQKDRQGDLMVGWSEMPRSPGHVFYDRLQLVLIEGGFDGFAEAVCQPYYAARMGAPSVPPGRYFRMHLVGYFEGIDSERGLEWRCSDSLSPQIIYGPARACANLDVHVRRKITLLVLGKSGRVAVERPRGQDRQDEGRHDPSGLQA